MLTPTHAQIDDLLVYILSINVSLPFTGQKLDLQQEKAFDVLVPSGFYLEEK